MYIKSCYIENFGRFHEFNIEFDKGLNVIKEDNGWGKTTLMAFIKAMLYGLVYKPNAKEFYDRKKYEPWGGGKFGGYMVFEVDNTEFKVTRFFGKKDVQDEFELIEMNTGKVSNAYSEKLGEEIFGIDMESYERSVYIGVGGNRAEITDSINAKLNNLLENADDIGNYDNAYANLDKLVKSLVKRGGGGEIQQKKDKIRELEERCRECDSKADMLKLYQKNIEDYEADKVLCMGHIADIDEKIVLTEAYNKRAHYEQLKDKYYKAEETRKNLAVFFDKRHPGEDELNDIYDICSEVSALEKNIESIGTVREYSDSTEAYVERCMQAYDEVSKLKLKLEMEKENIDELSEEIKELRAETEERQADRRGLALRIILLVLSTGVLAFGIVDILKKFTKYGIVFTCVGAVMLIICIVFLVSGILYNKQLEREDAEALELEEKCLVEIEQVEKKIAKLTGRCRKTEFIYMKYISEQLDCPTGNVLSDLAEINENADKYQRKCRLMEELDNKEAVLKVFFNDFELTDMQERAYYEKLQIIRDTLKYYKLAGDNLENCKQELEDFEKVNDIAMLNALPDIEECADITMLQASRQQYQEQAEEITGYIKRLEKTIDDVSLEVDRKQEYENETGRLREEVTALQNKYEVLTLAKDALETAKENLSIRYMADMKEAFEKYVDIFGISDNIKLGLDLKTKLEKNGKDWDDKYFSTGYRDMVDICVRFALVDAMFKDEEPVIILDDPFVNLDDTKLLKVKEAINEISKTKQIIYTVCGAAREL